MLTHEELAAILRPIIEDGVNQTVQVSSGALPPSQTAINQQVASITETAINTLMHHLPSVPRNLTAQEGFVYQEQLADVDGDWTKVLGTQVKEGEERPIGSVPVRRYVTCWRPVEDSTLNTEAIVVRGEN